VPKIGGKKNEKEEATMENMGPPHDRLATGRNLFAQTNCASFPSPTTSKFFLTLEAQI
jgi:hypothetical protein